MELQDEEVEEADEEVIIEEEEEEEEFEEDVVVEVQAKAAMADKPSLSAGVHALARKKVFLLQNDSAWRDEALEDEIQGFASQAPDPSVVIKQVDTLAAELAAEALKEAAEKAEADRLVKEAAEKAGRGCREG